PRPSGSTKLVRFGFAMNWRSTLLNSVAPMSRPRRRRHRAIKNERKSRNDLSAYGILHSAVERLNALIAILTLTLAITSELVFRRAQFAFCNVEQLEVANYRVPAPIVLLGLSRLLTSLYISRQVSHST